MNFVSIIEIIERLDFLFERIDWQTELLSRTILGWYLLRGMIDAIACELLEEISKENKRKSPTTKP